jgi:hypothetical protein
MKISKIALAIATIGMTLGAASVSAGELANEFGGFLSVGNTKSTNTASASYGYGSLHYGRFISPSVEAKGTLDYFVAGGSTSTGFSIGGDYFFTPVGHAGDIGSRSTTNAPSQTTWDVEGGMKYFVTDSAAIDVKYVHAEYKATANVTKMDTLAIGASVMF